ETRPPPHPAGDHKGPPFPASSTLAPTDRPASRLASRLRLMPLGRPQGYALVAAVAVVQALQPPCNLFSTSSSSIPTISTIFCRPVAPLTMLIERLGKPRRSASRAMRA